MRLDASLPCRCGEHGACERHAPLFAEVEQLRDAVKYAADAFSKASTEHNCDYCRADAARMERALDVPEDL